MAPMGNGCGAAVGAAGDGGWDGGGRDGGGGDGATGDGTAETGTVGGGSLLVEGVTERKMVAPHPESIDPAATVAKPWSIWRRERMERYECELIEFSLELCNYTDLDLGYLENSRDAFVILGNF
jgi:hypothetical protein